MAISVSLIGADTYEVVVGGGRTDTVETTHHVHMSQAYYRSLCGGTVTHEWVLVQSFRFLLEREPATAILEEFDLPVIGEYFPEYEREMRARLGVA
jgi:hypothetical protein